MTIGDRIRAARKAAELSQEEVARRAGLSLKGMGEIERGDIEDPHISSLAKIARALEVPVEDLVKEELAVPLDEASETGPPASPELEDWLLARCGHALLTLSDQELEQAFEKAHDEDPEAVKTLFQGATDELLAVMRPTDISREEEMLLRSRRGAATLQWAKAFTESGLYANADEEFQKSVKAIAEALQAA